VTWRIATTLAGENWFLVGDAAATLDPTSSRGVLKSMMTGMMAGHLAEPVIAGKMGWQQASSGYGEWLRDWFETDITQMSGFYGRLEQT
jgi:flavin-dependent dehydrogenase